MPIHTFIYAVASGTVVQSLSLSLSILLFLSLPLAFYLCVFFFIRAQTCHAVLPVQQIQISRKGGGPIVMAEGRREKAAALAVGSTPRGGIHLLPVELMAHPYISL